jgi:hypothetical protein
MSAVALSSDQMGARTRLAVLPPMRHWILPPALTAGHLVRTRWQARQTRVQPAAG